MSLVTFYGYSDDLIEIDGPIEGCGEHDIGGNSAPQKRVSFGVFCGADALRVTPVYTIGGCWGFAVTQLEEADPFPDWEIKISRKHDYSTKLEIKLPDESKHSFVERID